MCVTIPTTSIGGRTVSRLVCGSNPFLGFSHFSAARDRWLQRYFDVARIVEVLAAASEMGVNGLVGPADERLHQALRRHCAETGREIVWISTTYGHVDLEGQEREVRQLAQWGAPICLIHASYTDTHLRTADNTIEGMEDLLGLARSLGMAPGVSTHRPDALRACDAAGYDIECYILPLNVIGFLSNVETNWVAKIIRGAAKPVVCIKPLAAGRLMPFEGLNFVYHSIKPTDTVAVGMLSPEEAREDAAIAGEILAGLEASASGTGLSASPSKSTVGGGAD